MSRIHERELTNLERTLLGLAAQEPRSGYDLKSIFESTAMRQFSSSPGSIYPALKRLESAGLLDSQVEASRGDRSRRVYSLTPPGRVELEHWLRTEPTADELREDLRIPLLRLSLFGTIGLTDADAARFVTHLESAAEEYLRELEGTAEILDELEDPFPGFALGHGIAQLQSLRAWCRDSVAALDPEGACIDEG